MQNEDESGRTPLHDAAKYATIKVIRVLLTYEANLNIQDNAGKTLLHLAMLGVANVYVDVVKILLESGADPNIIDESGKKPLDLCIRGEIAEFLHTAEALSSSQGNGS